MTNAARSTEGKIRRAIVGVYVALANLGMNEGSAGNVSVRHGAGMLITPSGCTSDSLRPAQVVATDFDGIARGRLRPSSEWAMHAAVYARVPAAKAVIHTHADHCVAVACARRTIPAFHYMVRYFGGDSVPCVGYATFGTRELGAAAGEALERHTACLLANHGMLARGTTLRAAYETARMLETIARQYWLTLCAGSPVLLSRKNMVEVAARFRDYRRAEGRGAGDPWAVPPK
jgi:L-fuculose-phosphate aldolase